MPINLTSVKTVKKLLKNSGIRPSKRLGQNFLISKQALGKIIGAAELKPEDIVLEAGPGLGVLTLEIAKKVKQVIAVEKDERLVKPLENILKCENIKNVKVVNADILNFQFSNKYKLVANLPYNIAAAVVRKFLEGKSPPKLMVFFIQKEVGQRICSHPPKMSKLAVFCQFYSKPKIIAFVSKEAFYPQPRVDSAILKIIPIAPLPKVNKKLFSKIVRTGFSHPRKQLVNNLSKGLVLKREKVEKWLLKNNVKPNQRAETLTVDNWLNLTKALLFGTMV